MCRKEGRRCPGPKSQEHRDEVNAERREKYAFERDLPSKLTFFQDMNEVRENLAGCSSEISEAWDANLTTKEQIVMEDFTGMLSHNINRYLYSEEYRDAVDNDDSSIHNNWMVEKYGAEEAASMRKRERERLIESIAVIDGVLDGTKVPDNTVVYRGHQILVPAGKDPMEYITSHYKVGSGYSKESYDSTSLNPAVGAYFAGKPASKTETGETKVGVVFEMLTSEGAPIRSLSSVQNEDEVLLPRKKNFRVAGVHESVAFQSVEIDEESDAIHDNKKKTKHIVIRLIES
jgi:hypothetical protein